MFSLRSIMSEKYLMGRSMSVFLYTSRLLLGTRQAARPIVTRSACTTIS